MTIAGTQTLLNIIQTACKRIGIVSPTVALASNDQQILQMVALSEEEGQELAARYAWQALQAEATFTTLAAQQQTTLTASTSGFNYIVNDTIWNRTLRRPVYGPNSQQDWQEKKAMQLNGPFNSFRIVGDAINFYPNPAAGQTCAFEYITSNWVYNGGANAAAWTADTDTPLVNGQILVMGLIWRWKQVKGLDYAEDFNKYERRVMDMMSRDAGKKRLNLSGASYDIEPVILVPRGNFGA